MFRALYLTRLHRRWIRYRSSPELCSTLFFSFCRESSLCQLKLTCRNFIVLNVYARRWVTSSSKQVGSIEHLKAISLKRRCCQAHVYLFLLRENQLELIHRLFCDRFIAICSLPCRQGLCLNIQVKINHPFPLGFVTIVRRVPQFQLVRSFPFLDRGNKSRQLLWSLLVHLQKSSLDSRHFLRYL